MCLAVKKKYTEDDAGLWNLHAFLALQQDLDSHPIVSPSSIGHPLPASTNSFLTSLNWRAYPSFEAHHSGHLVVLAVML